MKVQFSPHKRTPENVSISANSHKVGVTSLGLDAGRYMSTKSKDEPSYVTMEASSEDSSSIHGDIFLGVRWVVFS